MKLNVRPMAPYVGTPTADYAHLDPNIPEAPPAPSILVRNPFTFSPPGLPPINVVKGSPKANG